MINEVEIIASTYDDICNVYRQSLDNKTGFDDFKEELVYQNLECAVDFDKGSFENLGETIQAIGYTAILFTRPSVQIKAGDRIHAIVQGRDIEFRAGEGVYYKSHNEIPLIREDVA